MTRKGGPDEAATQVISTSGSTASSGEQQASGDAAAKSAGQAQVGPAHPATAGGTEAPTRTVPARPDARRPDTRRSEQPRSEQPRDKTAARPAVTPEPAPREGSGRRWERRFSPQPVEPPDRARVRRARLRAVRVDPWSVMKTAFLLSIAFAVVTVVAVSVVWYVLQAAGVYDSISRTITDVLGSASDTRFNLEDYIGLQRVLGFTALICVVDIVLITAIATLCAFLYNLSASLLGGLEVTLAEEE